MNNEYEQGHGQWRVTWSWGPLYNKKLIGFDQFVKSVGRISDHIVHYYEVS